MVFRIPMRELPRIEEAYEIERKTVWRCADQRNILLFITDGSCQIEVDGEKYVLQKGDAIIIPSGTEYIRRPVKDILCRLFYVHFTTSEPLSSLSLKDAIRELRDNMTQLAELPMVHKLSHMPKHLCIMRLTATGDDFERLSELLRQIPIKRRSDPNVAPMLVSLCLVEFLASISLGIAPTSQDGTVNRELPHTLRQAMSYIQMNHDRKLSTDSVSEYCHLSPQHLIRLFKKHLSVTPLEYITKNKISHAVELLRGSELSVKEIAVSLGYDNPHYFTRLFTREVGHSPTELRERIRTYSGGAGAFPEK